MLLLLPAPVTEDFVVRGKYWSKLKLICSQPHRRDKPFGVAMIRVLEELGSARSAVKVNLVLVYNIRRPSDIYRRFGGVQGSAYLVGGVSVQFQKSEDIVLAPIRAGVGLRIGANVGYLKYTRRPTWNPF